MGVKVDRHRSGFILVMTLFLIAIVGLLLVSLARYSLSFATSTVRKHRELQTKWGRASCQKFVFQNPRTLLTEIDGEPMASSRATVVLSDQRYEMVLADESAKLDVNWILGQFSRERVRQEITPLVGTTLPVRLRLIRAEYQSVRNEPIESWGQVFGIPANQSDPATVIFEATQKITCWSRTLNYRSADPDILRQAIRLAAGNSVAVRIVRRLEKEPDTPLKQILEEAATNKRQQEKLNRLLSPSSLSQSLWIRATAKGKTSTSLTVRKGFTESISRVYNFSW